MEIIFDLEDGDGEVVLFIVRGEEETIFVSLVGEGFSEG
jgi:hypothetical protein